MSKFLECELGLYEIFWDSGGSSLAAIGNDYNGDRWMAPCNWACPAGGNPVCLLKDKIDEIIEMRLITSTRTYHYEDTIRDKTEDRSAEFEKRLKRVERELGIK